MSSKSHDLEGKLLSKIKEAAEEVERKVGELLHTCDVCVCAVLVSLVLTCSLALLFHLLRRKAQVTSHLFIFIMNVLFYTVLVGLPCSPGVSSNLMSSLVWSPLVSPSFWGSPLVDQWRLGRPRGLVKAHGSTCCLSCTHLYYCLLYVASIIAALLIIFIFR